MHIDYKLLTDLPLRDLMVWAIQVSVVAGLAILITFGVGFFSSRALERVNGVTSPYFRSFIESFHISLKMLVWILAISWILQVTEAMASLPILKVVPIVHRIAIILVLAFFFLRMVNRSYHYLKESSFKHSRLDSGVAEVIYKVTYLVMVVALSLMLLQSAGISITGILAFGGVGGLAVGLAAKDMLANLFGGLVLYLDRPFGVGDKIRILDSEVEGWVEDIGWRKTRVRNYERQPIYVPNSFFGNSSVINASRISNRRIRQFVGLRYKDMPLIPVILKDIREYLNYNRAIDKSRIMEIRFAGYAVSSLEILIYCFADCVEYEDYLRIQEEILLKVGKIVIQHGAEIAFPTRTLNVSCEAKDVSEMVGDEVRNV